MESRLLTFNYQGSHLIEAPSIHFNPLWADLVNMKCRCSDTKPEAIAVELGPRTAAALRDFIKELGVEGDREMPVMLGLFRRNRMIRSSMKQKALKIQMETGKDLNELSPDVLNRELGYTAYNLVCLSPTDSIIEAIRCSIEMDLPLYGVDLEEVAGGSHTPVLIQDPLTAKGNLTAFIAQNAPYASQQRDEEIDGRREIVMAARLKNLLQKYRRVLFAYGIAHWLPLRKLLEDSSILPSLSVVAPEFGREEFTRVVVHPLIAIHHMDLFPALSRDYETLRNSMNGSKNLFVRDWKDLPFKILQDLLNRAYRDYFSKKAFEKPCPRRGQDLESLSQFEGYLWNLCLLNHRLIPDLFMAIKAAHQTMSREFVKSFAETLMHFPWVSPEDYPEYSLVIPPSENGTFPGLTSLVNKDSSNKRKIFILSVNGSNPLHLEVEIPYEWEETELVLKSSIEDGLLHTWTPWDHLISSMSLRAIERTRRGYEEVEAKVFDGSLSDGIDLKKTLLASCRGDDRLYVRHITKRNFGYDLPRGDGFPVVWILQLKEHKGAEWTALYESCSWMAKYLRDRRYIDEIREKKGNKMIALIGYGELSTKTKASEKNKKIRSDRYHGIVIYQPICWSKKQFACWIEATGYRRNPFCERNGLGKGALSDLNTFFEEELGIRTGEFDWSTTLMLFGIPFAKDVMTVVIPEGYRINPVVFKKARKYRVEICTTTLSSFTPGELERVAMNHMAPAITYDPRCVFPKSVAEAIGESQTDYQNLVPRSILEFGEGFY